VGIYDLILTSGKKVVVADNNSFVKVYQNGKLVKTLGEKTAFLSE
jgi:hypothetical protein